MDRPTTHPFRDAAMRADPTDFRTPNEPVPPSGARAVERGAIERGAGERGAIERGARERGVVSDTGIPAHAEPPVERRRFSLGATFLGWSVAAFFTLVFVAIIGAILGNVALAGGDAIDNGNIESFAIGGLIGYLLATFAAYLIGGYAAGRIALWDGVKHGALTVAWAVLFGIVAVLASAYVTTTGFTDVSVPLDVGDLTIGGVIALVLTLAAMIAGATWGGAIGERYHDRVHGARPEKRRAFRTRTRGRPL